MSTGIDKGDDRQLETDYKSRTRKKKEDRALQRLGEQLVALPSGQLETIALPDELRTAVEFARKISKHGARRRQIKYIGALMRHIDPQPIQIALDRIRSANLRP
jgi:ribosome-associated protein